MDERLDTLARRLGERLTEKKMRVVTAESCTGGWVAKVLTDIAGSSAWFERGFVTYSNAAKQEMLGVRPATLAAAGAVSEAVVKEMVRGALANSGASLAVAISGIAGPGGGSSEKPVGMVWLAWGRTGAEPRARVMVFDGDRKAVRCQAVAAALQGALDTLFD
jgi:nicotinamide-nucleotide amidase